MHVEQSQANSTDTADQEITHDDKAARRHERELNRLCFVSDMEAYQEAEEMELLRRSARHSRSVRVEEVWR